SVARTPRSAAFPYTTLFRSLERRGLLGDGLVHGHDVGRDDRHGNVWRADLCPHGEQSRDGQRNGGEFTGGDCVWDELRGELRQRSEEHTSELQSLRQLVCRL